MKNLRNPLLLILLMFIILDAKGDDSGYCGGPQYIFEEATGTFKIFGSGVTYNFTGADHEMRVWKSYKDKIKNVIINQGPKNIGSFFFSGCSNLTSVVIPNNVRIINRFAFSDCTSLKKITLPSQLTSLSIGVFSGCTSLSKIVLPKGVEKIEGRSLFGCTNLRSITIPASVTYIQTAFENCVSLDDIYCYADPNKLTWLISHEKIENSPERTIDGIHFKAMTYYYYDEFRKDGKTKCHVKAQYLATYKKKFSDFNLIFVGDLK